MEFNYQHEEELEVLSVSTDGTRRATARVKVPSSNPGEATLWCPWMAQSQKYILRPCPDKTNDVPTISSWDPHKTFLRKILPTTSLLTTKWSTISFTPLHQLQTHCLLTISTTVHPKTIYPWVPHAHAKPKTPITCKPACLGIGHHALPTLLFF